ncbi:retrotransposon protein [Cucumis melo var. makuwa]|uniref:Retrotransposon protein n=1 Tax=Cucumis melo var. makuwa TaxID=1194695 RepID=A0A5D3DDB3_CUCMM|nr:retrotransposon protein [Cucumis melo var. makuwa]TYK21508.1 retrotransposon protein [Cucumis melo var. makuwa]
MAKSVLMDAFVTELEPTLQAEVKSQQPFTLEDCMREAQLVNDRNLALKLALNEVGIRGPGTSEAQTQVMQDGKGANSEKKEGRRTEYAIRRISIPIKGNYTRGEPPVRRFSYSEFRARLDKGLCFHCHEEYSQGHRCKIKENRELMLLGMNEEEDKDEAEIKETEPNVVELKTLEAMEETEIAL